MRHSLGYRVAVLVLAVGAGAGAQESASAPKDLKEELGAAVREVKATPGQQDDVELAKDLLAAARDASQAQERAVALCEAAHELAAPAPEGHNTAAEAMGLLAQTVPQRALACRQEVLAIRRKQQAAAPAAQRRAAGERVVEALEDVAGLLVDRNDYAQALTYLRQAASMAGDIRLDRQKDLEAEADRVAALERIAAVSADLQARLKKDPLDAYARRRLIDLYVIELDQPARAVELVAQETDEVLRTYVPLAAKPPSELSPQLCLELGNWYYSLRTKGTTPLARPAMLQRAQAYLEKYLERAKSTDLAAIKVRRTLEEIDQELETLASQRASGRWVDVLKLVDPAKHAVEGRWLRQGSRIGVAAADNDRVVIPVAPKGDYELKVQFARSKGDGDVNVFLPVGPSGVAVALSEHTAKANGLSEVKGQFYKEEGAPAAPGLANRSTHSLQVKVTTKEGTARLRAVLDGKRMLTWSGPVSELSIDRQWRLPSQGVLGLGTLNGCTTTFSGAQLRMLSGKASPVELDLASADEPSRRDGRRNGSDRWRTTGGGRNTGQGGGQGGQGGQGGGQGGRGGGRAR